MSTPLILSAGMVREHLSQLTDGWFAHRDAPPQAIDDYASYADQVRLSAEASGDMPWFAIALEHLVASQGVALAEYGDDSYAFSDAQMRGVIDYVLRRIGHASDARAANVVLEEMSAEAWRARRAALESSDD